MRAYLVRWDSESVSPEHAHTIVGIFVAATLDDLFWAIDEYVDPYVTEFLALPQGGIYWGDDAQTNQLPLKDEEDGGIEPINFAGAHFSSDWHATAATPRARWRNGAAVWAPSASTKVPARRPQRDAREL